MQAFIAFTAILLLLYSLLILYYHWIWDQIPQPSSSLQPSVIPAPDPPPRVKVSIIIPARNEELHIANCLNSILDQTYPVDLTELIVVNDFSTDATASVVNHMGEKLKLINLSDYVDENSLNAYKKKAIETGIAQAQGELILCTDADCIVGPEWIETIVRAYVSGKYAILAGPVKILTDASILSKFQALDFISLQGITGAALRKNLYPMCNGANLAYSRDAFNEVEGFKGIDHIASGDDMLLMRKMQSRFPGKATYLKDMAAIVSTEAADSLRSFFRQRIRWASKISHYRHPVTFITLGLVYAMNFCLLLMFLLSFHYGSWRWLLFFLIFKIFAEYFFVFKVAAFFQQTPLMKYFILSQPFHILYTVIAGAFGAFGRYRWKGRVVK